VPDATQNIFSNSRNKRSRSKRPTGSSTENVFSTNFFSKINNGGKLSVELLPQGDIQKEIFNNCRINIDTLNKKIKDAIYQMSETYFTRYAFSIENTLQRNGNI
jgi:hypothetical protein